MKKKFLVALIVVAVFAGLGIVYATSDSKNSGYSNNMLTAKIGKTSDCCNKDKSGECKMKGKRPCDIKGTEPSEK